MSADSGARLDLADIPVTTLRGESTTFGDLADGRATLVVNVASRCGLVGQYEVLEQLHKTYSDRGFTVIGFPSNQFLQELSTARKIEEYCSATWGVTFPMSEKVRVNGKNAHLLYKQLTTVPGEDGKAGRITWNFEKFVISPTWQIARFSPKTAPDAPQVIAAIESVLPG
jgi:glutathione peroxidase